MTKNDAIDPLYEKFKGKYSKQQIKYAIYHIEQAVAHYVRTPSIGVKTVKFTNHIQLKISERKMRNYLEEDRPQAKKEEIEKYFIVNGKKKKR